MKLPAVDNEFIFIGRDPRSSSLFGNKYLPVVVVDTSEKKKKWKYCAQARDEINRDTARLLIAPRCQMAEIIVIDSIVIRASWLHEKSLSSISRAFGIIGFSWFD